MSRQFLGYAFASVVCLAFTSQALAHAHLTSATPPDGKAVAASPNELDLNFSEALNLKFSGVTLTGPDKVEVKLRDPILRDGDKTFVVTIPDKLAPGIYAVQWHVLSNDGHKTQGSYTFTVKP